MMLDAQLVPDMAWWAAAVMGFWGICYIISGMITIHDAKDKSVISNPTTAQRFETADLLFSLPFYILLFVLALQGSIDLQGDVNSRWHGITFSSRLFQILYVVRMSLHCPIQWVVLASNPKLRLQMTAHHVLSIICFGGSLLTLQMHFWATLDGCCEFTSIFLNVVYAYKSFAPERQNSIFAQLSGVLLWIGFLVFRMALFPMWLYLMYIDATKNPADSWDSVNAVLKIGGPCVTVFLLVISSTWFVPITKGLLKALGSSGKKDKTTFKKE